MYAIEYIINMKQRIVKIAQLSNGKTPFIDWIESLDKVTKSRVQSRLTRLLENNFGDHKKIDNKKITKAYTELVIHKRSEIDIHSEDIMELLNRKPGKYLKEIYQDIEREILYRRLDNNKESISKYILEHYQ